MFTPEFETARKRLAARASKRVEKPGVMETSVSLILTPGARGLEALFIRRAEREGDPWSGHVALPGGRREPGDADRLATAVRETEEEVGVALKGGDLLGTLDDLHPSTPRLPALVISPYVFGLERKPRTRLSDEVSGVTWVPLEELRGRSDKAVIEHQGVPREVACFRAEGLVIWGLTYRILVGYFSAAG